MLSDSELERYQRQIVLHPVGGRGQVALKQASVVVVGAGGLGAPSLPPLAAGGVGRITIIDDDVVELSNLQRQTLFTTADIGRQKAVVAAERLRALNPEISVSALTARLSAANAAALLAGHDVIADGCDNFATRTIVNRTAVTLAKPLVSAAIGPVSGQLGVFAGHRPDQPCWACFAGTPTDQPGNSCADTGVLGAMAAVVGAAQALEIMRLIIGFGPTRLGQLWLFDAITFTARNVRVAKDPECPVCASS